MNVYDAAISRIRRILDSFDNVYVSFSGGKDSGALLHLTLECMRRYYPGRKLGVFHIDYEAQYQDTTDFVEDVIRANMNTIIPFHNCLPISAQCATSMYQSSWIPWESDKHDIWVRQMPSWAIREDACPYDFFTKGMWDYDFQEAFGPWYHRTSSAKRTCCLVGIRVQESLNRWRTIYSDKRTATYDGLSWTRGIGPGIYNAYPIYDWQTEDVWTAHARNDWPYNRLYDTFYKAGLTIHQMRVSSPFNDYAKGSLALYRAIDPVNWGRMLGRVDGVNFTGIYGGTTAMGWRSINLPTGHSWESYLAFLLSTLPDETRSNYENKLEISKRFWREQGGALSEETIASLRSHNVPIIGIKKSPYRTTKRAVMMEYLDDIDLPEFREIPTYKRMCVCILKNDHTCKYMGFGQTKQDIEKRKHAMRRYRGI